MLDRTNKGRSNIGEANERAKLTEEDIKNIRLDSRTQEKIAYDYKVDRTIIASIKKYKRWSHV